MRILRLTLKKMPFEVMLSGEKKEEFREVTTWIESRLFEKDGKKREYDRIEYVNGYGSHRPRFETDFVGFILKPNGVRKYYSNGLIVEIDNPIYVIKHSKILSTKNIT